MIPAVIERCAGIDVGRKFVDVCVMVGDAPAVPTDETRRFSTINEDRERLTVVMAGVPWTTPPGIASRRTFRLGGRC